MRTFAAARRHGGIDAVPPGCGDGRPSASDRGAVAVEFAMVLLPLVLILFGIIDFGRVYQQELSLSAAAREGVRVMAIQNSTTAAKASVKGAAPGMSPALTDAQISIVPPTCAVGTTVKVTVTYPMSSISGMFTGLFSGKNLTGVGVMRCGG